MAKQVREPIQVYLTNQERAELDQAAKELVVPARIPPGAPPPSKPVTTLEELLEELDADREDR